MRGVTRFLVTAGLLTTLLGAQPPRGGPGRWYVTHLDAAPTARTLVGLVRQRLGGRELAILDGSRVPGVRDVVLRVGRPEGGVASGRARVVSVDGRAPADLVLGPDPARVRRVLERLPTTTARVAVLGPATPWVSVGASVVAFDPGSVSNPAAFDALRGKVDVLLIPDDAALLGVAEDAAREAAGVGILTVTTAPWLARSVCALGIVPDLDAAAICVVQRLRRPDVARVRVPSLTTIHLAAWRRTGRPLTGSILAHAHRVHGTSESGT